MDYQKMYQHNLYCLRLLFSNEQIGLKELQEKTESVLQKYIAYISLSITCNDKGSFVLEIHGTLDIVDACHDLINQKLLNKHQLKCIRLLDEAGDEIRRQAYPILAEIEQNFRAFISQALAEVSGFDWWSSFAPPEIRRNVESVRGKHQTNDISLDPLEFTQFDDLIKIITAEVSEWSEDQPLSVNNFLELLSDCDSVTEIKTKLLGKIKKFSFWDIFSNFFTDQETWEQVKKSIKVVINERHKVMHHRPIRLGVINLLIAKKEEILAMLNTTKVKLTEDELLETKEEVKEYFEHSNSRLLTEINETLTKVNSEMLKSLVEPIVQTSEMFKSLMGPTVQTSKMFKSLVEPRIKTSGGLPKYRL